MHILPKTLILLLAFSSIISCKNSTKEKEVENEGPETKIETLTKKTMANGQYCYKNEYPFEDMTDMKDVIELNVSINGEEASGSYNWLPAEKDQRIGTFKGNINNGLIMAKYSYSQEGEETSSDIKITLNENNAVVEESGLNLGLGPITKISCD